MELGADVPNGFVHGLAIHLSRVDFARTPLDDLLPLGFGVGIMLRIEAGNELMGQIGAVVFRQRQHFGHLIVNTAHTQ